VRPGRARDLEGILRRVRLRRAAVATGAPVSVLALEPGPTCARSASSLGRGVIRERRPVLSPPMSRWAELEVEITRPERNDLEAIVALKREVHALHVASAGWYWLDPGDEALAKTIRGRLADSTTRFLVARHSSQVVGYVSASVRVRPATPLSREYHGIYLDEICVLRGLPQGWQWSDARRGTLRSRQGGGHRSHGARFLGLQNRRSSVLREAWLSASAAPLFRQPVEFPWVTPA